MRFVIPTIMHTGTHFISLNVLKNVPRNQRYVAHTQTSALPSIHEQIRGIPEEERIVLSPLRHPARVLESHKRRNRPFQLYKELWNNLIALDKEYDITYLVLDSPNREQQLQALSDKYGEKLGTGWDPVQSVAGTHSLPITDELLSEVPEEYIQFYLEKDK